MLFLLPVLSLAAHAADLEIDLPPMARVRVDGRPVRRRLGDRRVWALGLAPGEHEVSVHGLFGKDLARETVEVAEDERVILLYAGGAISELGRGPGLAVDQAAHALLEYSARAAEASAEAARAEAMAADAQARAAQAHAAAARAAAASQEVQALLYKPGFGDQTVQSTLQDRPADSPPLSGLSSGTGGSALASASFAGLDPTLFSVTLGGQAVPWDDAHAAFVATDLNPGTRPFTLELEGQAALRSPFTLPQGKHTACTILARPDGYDASCVAGGRPLVAADLVQPAADDAVGFVPVAPPMDETLFSVLVASVEGTPFAKDQVAVITSAADRHYFSCAQAVRLLSALQWYPDRLAALAALRPAIIDPENAFLIESSFEFSNDRATVRTLFSDIPAPRKNAPEAAPPGP